MGILAGAGLVQGVGALRPGWGVFGWWGVQASGGQRGEGGVRGCQTRAGGACVNVLAASATAAARRLLGRQQRGMLGGEAGGAVGRH